MKIVLQINSSLFSTQGASSRLADEFVGALSAQSPIPRAAIAPRVPLAA